MGADSAFADVCISIASSILSGDSSSGVFLVGGADCASKAAEGIIWLSRSMPREPPPEDMLPLEGLPPREAALPPP